MSFYEILVFIVSFILPLLLIYSALTEKTKPIFIFTIGYFICDLLLHLEALYDSILGYEVEVPFYDVMFTSGKLLLLIFTAVCVFSHLNFKYLKFLFYIPTVVLFIAFYFKTINEPFRFYGMSYRVADFIGIMGILFLTYALTEHKSAYSKSEKISK